MDVTEQNFNSAVIERSHDVPVVVDFWATWCSPCRQLTPVLEQAIADRAPKIELAKIDTDANQSLAQRYGIQGIPAVKAFKNGEVVAEFVGAQPPAVVAQFLDSLSPSEAELLAARGDETSLRQALELEPGRADAAVPLARILIARGETADAREVLKAVPGSFAADGLLARIELQDSSEAPDLSDAFTELDTGHSAAGLDRLLTVLPEAGQFKDPIRRVIVGELDLLGSSSDLARDTRRRLASALY